MSNSFHKHTDTLTKIIGILFVIISGIYALWQYTYAQEREFQKSFYDKQLDVVMEVFDSLSQLDSAITKEEKKAAANKFWMIYHGKARTFLDPKMFEKLKHPAEYVSSCVMNTRQNPSIDCNNYSSSMTTPGFAIVAREQLSKAWARSLSELGNEDPWTPLSH